MNIKHTLSIDQLIRNNNTGGVITAIWDLSSIDKNSYVGTRTKGEVHFTPSIDDDFIEYNDLTNDIVLEWVKSSIGNNQLTLYEKANENEINTTLSTSSGIPWTRSK